MSIWNYVFDSEWSQRSDIESLKEQAQAARARMDHERRDTRDRVAKLEQEVGELALLCRAMLQVLSENGGIKPEQLHAAMEKIDAEDGVIDGRVKPERERPKKKAPLKVSSQRRRPLR